MLTVVADPQVDPAALDAVRATRDALPQTLEEIRAIHMKVYATAVERNNEDSAIDVYEKDNLYRLASALRAQAWARADASTRVTHNDLLK